MSPASRPPGPARWLLRRLVHPADRRFVLADLEDGFERRAREQSPRRARSWYRAQVLGSVLPALRARWARRPRSLLTDRLADVRFAARSLAKSPLVTLVVIVSLAIGMAAATTVFTFANALLLRPSGGGLREPDRLVAVFTSDWDSQPYGRSSFPDSLDIAEQVTTLSDVAAYRVGALRVGDPGSGRRVFAEIVTGNYFDVLGVPFEVGRGFRADETVVGAAERVVVISPRLWRQELDGAPDVVGTALLVDGDPFTVVGVAPEGLVGRTFSMRVDAWVPVGIPGGVFLADEKELADRNDRNYGLIGRLAADADLGDAATELDLIGQRLAADHPQAWSDRTEHPRRLSVLPEEASRVPPDAFPALASSLTVILVGTGLLLAMACSNVASVLLARADQRGREIAVRQALGAGGRRIVSLLLSESLLLGLVSGGAALLLARWWVSRFDAIPLPVGDLVLQLDLPVDVRVFAFTFVLALAVSAAFGLAPVRSALRNDTVEGLRGGAGAGGPGRGRWMRRTLVVVQVAAALVFVVGSGVAYRSFDALVSMDWGVRVRGAAVMSTTIPEELDAAGRIAAYEELLSRIESRPEIAGAALGRTVEGGMFIRDARTRVDLPGQDPPVGGARVLRYNAVTPGYLELQQVRMLRGRTFTPQDRVGTPTVAVVTRAMARQLWGEREAIGRRFLLDSGETPVEVVGVAADARYQGYDGTSEPFFWLSLYQRPADRVLIVARGRTDAAAALPVLRDELRGGSGEEMVGVTPRRYTDLVNYQFAFLRLLGRLLGLGGGFGMLLATLGLYGVVAFAVTRRTRELAVRQAVGALPGQVMRVVLRDGLRLAAIGIVVGLMVVVPLSAVLRSGIRGIPSLDPVSALVGGILVLLVTAAASALPARRATRIDPARALREE